VGVAVRRNKKKWFASVVTYKPPACGIERNGDHPWRESFEAGGGAPRRAFATTLVHDNRVVKAAMPLRHLESAVAATLRAAIHMLMS
jgi:hypothetical protein